MHLVLSETLILFMKSSKFPFDAHNNHTTDVWEGAKKNQAIDYASYEAYDEDFRWRHTWIVSPELQNSWYLFYLFPRYLFDLFPKGHILQFPHINAVWCQHCFVSSVNSMEIMRIGHIDLDSLVNTILAFRVWIRLTSIENYWDLLKPSESFGYLLKWKSY